MQATRWSNEVVIAASAFAGLVGLLSLCFELAPRRRGAVPVAAPSRFESATRLEWVAGRRSLEGALTSRLERRLPGPGYKARLEGRGERLRLRVVARAPRVSCDEVAAAAREQLLRLTGHDDIEVLVKARGVSRSLGADLAIPVDPGARPDGSPGDPPLTDPAATRTSSTRP